ncbi:MAG: 4-hydroxy-tetrahydrodipicolinate synthase [Pseudanabaenaceae cyanobacterium SKYGB_i_bin29]|nr:4-hydroxy-tetrahydrodipicolinate synthase [Pseudanabaenaceae cyanobacterium SKYG29]MDW8421469.1 4-hydroxy-tetrahydrodipicolinate synthase [Pseudanabaenaceae cyanobacterium SKYGB_i_bin29]
MTIPFGRLITAMVTPFDGEGNVNYDMAVRLALHLIEQGSDAIVLCGTTGESPTLTWEEEYQLFQAVKQAVGDRAKILAGTGSNSTREAIVATQKAAALGLDGSLQVTPYYNKPPQAGLYAHFRAIAESAPQLPILLYNIPGRTACRIELDTILRLSEIPNIVGIKDSTGDLGLAAEVRGRLGESFAIYSGDDYLTLPLMAVGAVGVVSVASHLVGRDIKQMIDYTVNGRMKEAEAIHQRLLPLFRALFITTNPIPIKAALNLLGWEVGGLRLPLVTADEQTVGKLKQVLTDLGLST